MIRIFKNANYDFLKPSRVVYLVSTLLIVPGMILLAIRGPNYSIEFTGGTLIRLETARPVDPGVLRRALSDGGIHGSDIQAFGSDTSFAIRARLSADQEQNEAAVQATRDAVARVLDGAISATGTYRIVKTEAVSPKVGSELQGKALLAILVSFIGTLIYVAFRFEWRFGVSSVLGTAHDLLATVAFISYMNLEISLVLVAAVLTVKGYSLNDKIVIADRVRENLRKYRRQNFAEILNLSVNETLPRTILTGGTTLATTMVLSFLAGEVIRPFALVMSFGIVIGTLSSMFIASQLLLWIERRWPGEDARGVRSIVSRTSAPAPASAPSQPSPRAPQPAR